MPRRDMLDYNMYQPNDARFYAVCPTCWGVSDIDSVASVNGDDSVADLDDSEGPGEGGESEAPLEFESVVDTDDDPVEPVVTVDWL